MREIHSTELDQVTPNQTKNYIFPYKREKSEVTVVITYYTKHQFSKKIMRYVRKQECDSYLVTKAVERN